MLPDTGIDDVKKQRNAEYAKHINDPVLSSLKMESIRLLFICNPVVQETTFVIQSHVDVACPAEVDTLTDEEEDPNNSTETVEIQSVLKKFKIQHSSIKACGNRVSVT
jgi:hypothetical protein